MSKQTPAVWTTAATYASVILLAIVGVYVAFYFHATLVYMGLQLVKIPAVNRMGWNTSTINGLSRFLYLVIGALWLFGFFLLPGFLREAAQGHRLRHVVVRIFLAFAAFYLLCFLILLIL